MSHIPKQLILDAYTDVEFPGAFGGLERFQKSLIKEKNIKVSLSDIEKVLEKLPVYQIHALSKHHFKRRKLTAKGAGIDFHADLGYMPEFDGYKYFLLLVDLYSNFIYVEPLKGKTAEDVKRAFVRLFKKNKFDKFSSLGTDSGGEFTANRTFFKSKKIELYVRRGQNKAFQAENYIRIFKRVLYKYLRYKRSQNWPKAIAKTVAQVNNRRQKNLGPFTPQQINSPLNDVESRDVIKRSRPIPGESKNPTNVKGEFKINQFVYVNFLKQPLYKGFDTQRGTIYKIKSVDRTKKPYLYTLKELDGTSVEGKYYSAELKRAPNPEHIEHEIGEILKEKTDEDTGKKTYFVKWLFYPSKYDLDYNLTVTFNLPYNCSFSDTINGFLRNG